jgi:hypothetical protein
MIDEKLQTELKQYGVYTSSLDPDEHQTYFGNVGKLRFNQQIALINNKAKIMGDAHLENILATTKDKVSRRKSNFGRQCDVDFPTFKEYQQFTDCARITTNY